MQEFSPNRVWLQYRNNISNCMPVMGRMYTMTHSDETADLFVVAGKRVATDRIEDLRDEVIFWWGKRKNCLVLYGEVLVELDRDRKNAEMRNQIFTREMPKAIAAVRVADQLFFEAHPELDNANVYIYYRSCFSQYNRVMDYGAIGTYNSGCNE